MAIASKPAQIKGKYHMAVTCGFKSKDQGIFFLGDACRDAHPDMGMGVNDAALQATCALLSRRGVVAVSLTFAEQGCLNRCPT